jgi:hypothetical protein
MPALAISDHSSCVGCVSLETEMSRLAGVKGPSSTRLKFNRLPIVDFLIGTSFVAFIMAGTFFVGALSGGRLAGIFNNERLYNPKELAYTGLLALVLGGLALFAANKSSFVLELSEISFSYGFGFFPNQNMREIRFSEVKAVTLKDYSNRLFITLQNGSSLLIKDIKLVEGQLHDYIEDPEMPIFGPRRELINLKHEFLKRAQFRST